MEVWKYENEVWKYGNMEMRKYGKYTNINDKG